MMCQNCGKNEAVFHYKSNINGEVTEQHLCSECASALGYDNMSVFKPHDFFGSMLSDIFGTSLPQPGSLVPRGVLACPLCGSTARDIQNTGKVGCAQCYDVFSDLLTPYVRRIHGNARHSGKIPESAGHELKTKREIASLKSQLAEAIENQEFEKAAELRDSIKALEEGRDNESK